MSIIVRVAPRYVRSSRAEGPGLDRGSWGRARPKCAMTSSATSLPPAGLKPAPA